MKAPSGKDLNGVLNTLLASGFCALLLTAAGLKTLDATQSVSLPFRQSKSSPLGAIAIVQMELIGSFVFLAGVARVAVWRAGVFLFVAFALYSLTRALTGHDSCGCFGNLKVHPWWTFIIDIGVLSLLWLKRRAFCEPSASVGLCRPAACGMAFLVLSLVSVAVMTRPAAEPLRAGISTTDDGRYIILEPVKWIGSDFPIGDTLEPSVDLSTGHWTVLIYHHDCSKCQAALPRYQRLAEHVRGPHRSRVLCLEAPPFGEPLSPSGAAMHARLAGDREWFVEAPVEIQITNGNVTLASTELPSLADLP